MHCSCRAAPLRTFINGLAQVHRLESSSLSHSYISAGRSKPFLQELSIARNSRLFHQSRILSGNAAEAEVAATEVAQAETTEQGAAESMPSSSHFGVPQTHSKASEASYKDSRSHIGKNEFQSAWKPRAHTNKFASRPSERPRWQTGEFDTNSDRPRYDGPSPQRGGNYSGPRGGAKNQQWGSKSFQDRQQKWSQNREQKLGLHKGSSNPEEPVSASQPEKKKEVEDWRIQKEMLKAKFPDGWKPIKRLSPDALAGIRALNAQFPDIYTTSNLAAKFEVSPENIRRILKSHWQPSAEEEQSRQERWHRRGMQIWEKKAALGVKPPRKWRAEGITRDPRYHDRRRARIQRDKLWEEEETNKYRAYREGLQKAAGKVV